MNSIKWLYANDCPWHEHVCLVAAQCHVSFIQWMRKHDAPWHKSVAKVAIIQGNLPVLRYTHEHENACIHNLCHYALIVQDNPCLAYLIHHS